MNFKYKVFALLFIVLRVEQDAKVSIATNTDRWGLDRIDQEDLPLDNTYTPPAKTDGAGVTAYILDTGIMIEHEDFEGRASYGADFTFEGDGDGNGHGTHCAGTVGGKDSGVAKGVDLVAVKVLDSGGSGSWSGVIDGMNWVATNHKFSKGPGTVNMSLGGSVNQSINDAVNDLVDAGISVIVAAGNSDADACYYSPASAEKAITIGSTTITDQRSYFSNYGADCMTMFGPGSDIKSAWNNGLYNTISGTSMAAPHVVGVAALILGNDSNLTPAQVEDELLERAATDKISDPQNTPNKLLQIGEFIPPEPTVSPVPTTSPTSSPSLEPTSSAAPTQFVSKTMLH